MLQMVLHDCNFGIFTQTALVLFCLAFAILLGITFLRPRSQTDKLARLPLNDDLDLVSMSTATDTAIHMNGGERHE